MSFVLPVVLAGLLLCPEGTVPTATIANWMRIVATQTTRAQWYAGKGAMPASVIEKLDERSTGPGGGRVCGFSWWTGFLQ